MKVKTVKSEGLAHISYYLSSEKEALVIDPRRDCEIYIELAKEECTKIKYILETHRNEDLVTGSLELQKMTEAEIAHSNELSFNYGEHNLTDGDTLNLGNLKIKTSYTPGHTNESLCYSIYENNEPILLFSGDTLFAGSIGRTDLYGKTAQPTQAEKIFISLHEKILPLGNHVLVYPAHGAGSVCGHGISGLEPTTLGYEKKTNPYLKLVKEELIKKVMGERLVVPKYFRQIEKINLNGPPPLSELPLPKPISLHDFEECLKDPDFLAMDTRKPSAFAGAHIPKSVSVWLGGASVYPGWFIDADKKIILVLERPEDVEIIVTWLRRLGFDNFCGFLCGGMEEWQEAGKPIRSFSTMSASQLKDKLERKEISVVDVREPNEWSEDGYIPDATLMFFADLPEKAASLQKDKPLAVICSVGNRSSIGASILEIEGFENITNVLGGMTAWYNLGYPTKKMT